MKRSEMLAILRDAGADKPTAAAVLKAMSKVVPWDPEEPLAERLKVVQCGCVLTLGTPGLQPNTYQRVMNRAEADEAVRLWDRRTFLTNAAKDLRDLHAKLLPGDKPDYHELLFLADGLEGK